MGADVRIKTLGTLAVFITNHHLFDRSTYIEVDASVPFARLRMPARSFVTSEWRDHSFSLGSRDGLVRSV